MSIAYPDTEQRAPKDAMPPEVYKQLERVLRFYANTDNYEDEQIGFEFQPGTSDIDNDGGVKAQVALKWIRGQL